MKSTSYLSALFALLLVFSVAEFGFAGGPTLQHMPPTGLRPDSPDVDMRPDNKGGTKISQSTKDTKTEGNTTATTTVTKTHTANKDGSVTDRTVIKTESVTKGTTKDGQEYVTKKTSRSTTTTRQTDAKGNTETSSKASGRSVEFNEPNEDGTSNVKSSTFSGKESLITNGQTGISKRKYVDDDGDPVTVTTLKDGTTSTRTERRGGAIIVNKKPDGEFNVIEIDGKERTQKWYDKDGEQTHSEHRDKKGNTTKKYKDKDGRDVTEVIDKKGRPKTKTVVELNGTSYQIRYLRGKPWKLIEFDKDGKKIGTEIIDPEDRKEFRRLFGDDLGVKKTGGGSNISRDLFAGRPKGMTKMKQPQANHHYDA